jgi:hypothetical protein
MKRLQLKLGRHRQHASQQRLLSTAAADAARSLAGQPRRCAAARRCPAWRLPQRAAPCAHAPPDPRAVLAITRATCTCTARAAVPRRAAGAACHFPAKSAGGRRARAPGGRPHPPPPPAPKPRCAGAAVRRHARFTPCDPRKRISEGCGTRALPQRSLDAPAAPGALPGMSADARWLSRGGGALSQGAQRRFLGCRSEPSAATAFDRASAQRSTVVDDQGDHRDAEIYFATRGWDSSSRSGSGSARRGALRCLCRVVLGALLAALPRGASGGAREAASGAAFATNWALASRGATATVRSRYGYRGTLVLTSAISILQPSRPTTPATGRATPLRRASRWTATPTRSGAAPAAPSAAAKRRKAGSVRAHLMHITSLPFCTC